MTYQQWFDLALDTVRTPRDVAAWLIDKTPERSVVIQLLVLVAVLNGFVIGISFFGAPVGGLEVLLAQPVLVSAMLVASVVVASAMIALTGRLFGGRGRFLPILFVLTWLQALRLAVQVVLFFVSAISAGLSGLIALGVSVLGVWILVNMVDVAHGLNSLPKAVATVVLGFVGMAFVLSVLLTPFDFQQMGML